MIERSITYFLGFFGNLWAHLFRLTFSFDQMLLDPPHFPVHKKEKKSSYHIGSNIDVNTYIYIYIYISLYFVKNPWIVINLRGCKPYLPLEMD